ncbi:uracil phosphoribosyltransferase [Bdellovibrio svalbardensis]|uniref:Uracil phosphoribosyltransferase n=1 Tax=Bdellovibrio svalbardensis TaxID=2972972 RepID=A0ABT6DLG1_9BACT|nr:uracil phosphoribosyltransferase [Bdellovibrio svalbardensis]MDG0817648.1 uracil phosphoribosyltransferase [Bdellovibrio svalbardensis]
MNKNVKVIDHPLLKHKLGYLRDKNTYSHDFREIVKEVSKVLIYEAMRDWKHLESIAIETPIAKAQADRIVQPPVVVSIMRAGNGMLDAALSMIPFASTGFIGIYRDKFIHNTVEYYFKMPQDIKGKEVLLCDPLIATADTIIAAIDRLKNYGVGKIKVISILASQSGLEKVQHHHPDVEVYTINIENEMNDMGYLVPGLGDAGDRLFQTK